MTQLAHADSCVYVVQVTLGSMAGFCSGYAVKKVSKVAAFAIGAGFIVVQLLRYAEVIGDVSNYLGFS